MIGVKEVGKYNVDFAGKSYDNGVPEKCYEMVNIDTFDEDENPVGARKTLYFLHGEDTVIPKFETEAEVDRYMCYPNNCRLSVKVATIVTVER